MHSFKPYADDPTICVAELPCGDTCNQSIEYHADECGECGEFMDGEFCPNCDTDEWSNQQ